MAHGLTLEKVIMKNLINRHSLQIAIKIIELQNKMIIYLLHRQATLCIYIYIYIYMCNILYLILPRPILTLDVLISKNTGKGRR